MNRGRAEMIRGFLAADALAWQNLHRRSHLLPFWTRRKRREIEIEHEQHGIIDEALPFALNQPTAPFRGAPGTNSEWLTFQMLILLQNGGRYDREVALAAWRDLAGRRESLRVTVGVHAALRNIAAGVKPPISGHDNPHYFDDSACFRAVSLVLADLGDLEAQVESDAEISNAEDGVWAARALAETLRGALDGADCRTALDLALRQVPEGSWLAIQLDRALRHAETASSVLELIQRLGDDSANHAYDYGNSAPETVAISLAILRHTGGDLEPSLLAALALPRTAASVAPMVGALCGALGTSCSIPTSPHPLQGIALPHLAGRQPLELLGELTATTY